MSDAPIVSVIIPCYNTGGFLAEAIGSVLCQTFRDIELIVVDDGSTDDTSLVVAGFLYDGRVRYVQQKNRGLSAARNTGVALASGQFIALLDADDIWEPEKLERQVSVVDGNNLIGMTFTDFSTFDSQGIIAVRKVYDKAIKSVTFPLLFSRNNFIYPSTVLLRKSAINECGGFDTSLRSIEDYDMWLRIAHKFQIIYVTKSLVKIRQHDSNMSMNVRRMLESELQVLEKHRREFSDNVFRRRQAKCYYLAADRFISQQLRFKALKPLAAGLVRSPLCVDLAVVLIKLFLGGKRVKQLRRGMDNQNSFVGRLYWHLYARY